MQLSHELFFHPFRTATTTTLHHTASKLTSFKNAKVLLMLEKYNFYTLQKSLNKKIKRILLQRSTFYLRNSNHNRSRRVKIVIMLQNKASQPHERSG